jgi:hypothetical protein
LTPLPMCFEPKKDTSFQHCRGIINNKSKKNSTIHFLYTLPMHAHADVHPYYRVKHNSRLCTITGVIFLKIVTDQKWYAP